MRKPICGILIALLCGLVLLGPAVVSAQKITANVASTFPPDSPQDKGLNKFKQLVAERSGGRIEVLIHPSNAMGDERSTFEMLSAGSVEYGAVGTNDVSTFFPKYFICEVPYVFSSQDDFWKFWNGPGQRALRRHREAACGAHRRRHLPRRALPHRQPAGQLGCGREGPQDAAALGQVLVQGLGGLRRAALDHRLRRGLHGPQDRGRRGPGEPARDHPELQVLRGAEVPDRHRARVLGRPRPVVGQVVERPEEGGPGAADQGHERGRGVRQRRSPRTATRSS